MNKLEIFIDTGDIGEIKKGLELYPLTGITTNPIIFKKECKNRRDYFNLIEELIKLPIEKVLIQVPGKTSFEMIKNARKVADISNKITIKIPIDKKEGFNVINKLHKEGVKALATELMNVTQAILAAYSNAEYVAPFMNFVEKAGRNSSLLIKNIRTVYDRIKTQTKIIAADIKTISNFNEAVLNGADAATLSYGLLDILGYDSLSREMGKIMNKNWSFYF